MIGRTEWECEVGDMAHGRDLGRVQATRGEWSDS